MPLKPHQREGVLALALAGGGLLADQQGLGKTAEAIAWARLALEDGDLPGGAIAAVLAPPSLHDQWAAEIAKFGGPGAGGRVARPRSAAEAASLRPARGGVLWVLCDYAQLATGGGGDDLPADGKRSRAAVRRRRRQYREWSLGMAPRAARLPSPRETPWERLLIPNGIPSPEALQAAFARRYAACHPAINPGCARAEAAREALLSAFFQLAAPGQQPAFPDAPEPLPGHPTLAEAEASIGEERGGITCCWVPSIAAALSALPCPIACIADEAVRLKEGPRALPALAAARLRAEFRLALTGTPYKNRIGDLFWLACWADNGRGRFPFEPTDAGERKFLARFGTTEEKIDARKPSKRKGSGFCDAPGLWKALAGIMVRRTKAEIGDLPPLAVRQLRVPAGESGAAAYAFHLDNPARRENLMAELGTQVGRLRLAAAAPWSDRLPGCASACPWTPKLAAALELCADAAETGEPLVLFSALRPPLARLSALLPPAIARRMDGTAPPSARAADAAAFKRGAFPIALCGIDAMGEGHSFEHCRRLALIAPHWAYDANAQAIERVHRLTSTRPVEAIFLVAEGTVEERIVSLFEEKAAAASLAIDASTEALYAGAAGGDRQDPFDLIEAAKRAWQDRPQPADAEAEAQCRAALARIRNAAEIQAAAA